MNICEMPPTIFSSSHILSDAETLCSRVAIVAGGRLATIGKLGDMSGYEVRGWEVVMSDVAATVLAGLASKGIKATTVADGRCTFDLPKEASAEAFIAEMHSGGARLVSVSPIHTTLEEIFVQQVRKVGSAREGAL